jgi:outer membrane protein assembly factor BamA
MIRLLTTTFTLLLTVSLLAQYTDSIQNGTIHKVKVDSISIIGNEITEEDIILRELTFESGDEIDTHILNYNKERIYSLGIFNRVELYPLSFEGKNVIIILVEESWYIYPIPFIELKDKDWDKVSYGMDFSVRNFRGRNETVRARLALGYDPSLFLAYYVPYLIKQEAISFSIETMYKDVRNKSRIAASLYGKNFDQKFISSYLVLGKRLGIYHTASLNIGFNYIETPFYLEGISASGERIDRILSAGASYIYDTRDLIQYPKEGILAWISYQLKGFGFKDINYQILNIDFREYRKIIGDLTAKWRFTSRMTFGKLIPYYDYSYIGFVERIRGHFATEQEGNDYYISSLELFHPIFKDVHISFDNIPLLPKELFSYRIGLYAQLFLDTGATRFRGSALRSRDFLSGYGAGLTLLILPYNILRIEFALDEYRNHEIIFDLGISF